MPRLLCLPARFRIVMFCRGFTASGMPFADACVRGLCGAQGATAYPRARPPSPMGCCPGCLFTLLPDKGLHCMMLRKRCTCTGGTTPWPRRSRSSTSTARVPTLVSTLPLGFLFLPLTNCACSWRIKRSSARKVFGARVSCGAALLRSFRLTPKPLELHADTRARARQATSPWVRGAMWTPRRASTRR